MLQDVKSERRQRWWQTVQTPSFSAVADVAWINKDRHWRLVARVTIGIAVRGSIGQLIISDRKRFSRSWTELSPGMSSLCRFLSVCFRSDRSWSRPVLSCFLSVCFRSVLSCCLFLGIRPDWSCFRSVLSCFLVLRIRPDWSCFRPVLSCFLLLGVLGLWFMPARSRTSSDCVRGHWTIRDSSSTWTSDGTEVVSDWIKRLKEIALSITEVREADILARSWTWTSRDA